jgi:methionyl aminopeptidase
MRRAGRVVAEMHERTRALLRPGVTTAQLDAAARAVLESRGATSNFLGYHGYPAVICASVNDEVVHGIPGDRVLTDGDVVSIDCGAVVDGWHGDAAYSAVVGEGTEAAEHLVEVCRLSLDAGIAALVAGNRMGDLGHAVQSVAEAAGCAVVTDYAGHAIGRAMHESPSVPNVGRVGTGRRFAVGDVYAIEPMITAGRADVAEDEADGWTVRTVDGSLAAHWEHTIAVTRDGPEVLTLP